ADMHKVMWRERVAGFGGLERWLADGAQAKYHSRRNGCFTNPLRRSGGKGAKRQAFQKSEVVPQKARQVDAEVVEREIGDRDAAAKVFQVDDCILHLLELLAAVLQVVHRVAGLLLNKVLFTGRRDVEQHHAP